MAVTVICTYRVKKGKEKDFETLLAKHWRTLREHDLATETPSKVYSGTEGPDAPYYVEIFEWKDEAATETAHELPEVMAVWEPMGALCEERAGRPSMEFPHVQAVALDRA
jgi:quinol monooxygenase YgiN